MNDADNPTTPRRVPRRRFLARGGAGSALIAAGAIGGFATAASGASTDTVVAASLNGAHQPGIATPPQPASAIVALDVTASSRTDLATMFETLTAQLRSLTAGGPVTEAFNAGIAGDNGILGPSIPPRALTATVSVGASLFDRRFGLRARKPSGLTPMRTFPNDNLDPAHCGGDLSLVLQAADRDTVTHALRRVLQAVDGVAQARWRIDGFVNPPRPSGAPRNLFGFSDGISNPNTSSRQDMSQLIWVKGATPAQEWTSGGSYQVIRIIRQLVEFWDRVSVQEQETMIGRRRDTGAPLGADTQTASPDFAADPTGAVIPLTAHLRLANPRTPHTADQRILRRPFNYDNGLDNNGNLDQGLAFICYQQDIQRQFERVQSRLIGEPMVDYISPVGGGYFFTLPGLRDATRFYAQELLA